MVLFDPPAGFMLPTLAYCSRLEIFWVSERWSGSLRCRVPAGGIKPHVRVLAASAAADKNGCSALQIQQPTDRQLLDDSCESQKGNRPNSTNRLVF